MLQSNNRDPLTAVLARGTSLPPEPPPASFLALRQDDAMLSRYFHSFSSQISAVTLPSLPGSDPAPPDAMHSPRVAADGNQGR